MVEKVFNQLNSHYKENVWEEKTLGDILVDWAECYRDQVAIVDEDREITYYELNELANRYANGFVKQGITKGDKIVLQIPKV